MATRTITYRAIFRFTRRPPYEVVLRHRHGVVAHEPGEVAFSLLAQSEQAWLERFGCNKVFAGTMWRDAANAAHWLANYERPMLERFIETVLLRPAPFSCLEAVPPSRRMAVFQHLQPGEGVKRHLANVTLLPGTAVQEGKWKMKAGEFSGRTKGELGRWRAAWDGLEACRQLEQGEDVAPERLQQVHDLLGIDVAILGFARARPLLEAELYRLMTQWEAFTWRYQTDDLLAVAWLELHQLADADITVKRCKKCSWYFVPDPPNGLSCRKCKQDHTRQQLYYERKKEKMSEEEKARKRREHTEYMRHYRKKKKAVPGPLTY